MTKEEWHALSPKGQWDIQVAMRGPDCYNSDQVKWLTTAVIRRTMMGVIRVGGMINHFNLNFVVIPSGGLKEEQGKLTHPHPRLLWDYSHFFSHIGEAASWLKLSVVYVSAPIWFKGIEEGSVTKMLTEWLTDPNLTETQKGLLTTHLTHLKSSPFGPPVGEDT